VGWGRITKVPAKGITDAVCIFYVVVNNAFFASFSTLYPKPEALSPEVFRDRSHVVDYLLSLLSSR